MKKLSVLLHYSSLGDLSLDPRCPFDQCSPNNVDQNLKRIPEAGDDWNSDGVRNAGEVDAGSDSKNSNGSPVGGWLSVTGNLPGDQLKTTSRSYTIKKGDSRILVVSTGSVSLLVTNQEGEVANPKEGHGTAHECRFSGTN